MAWSDGPGDWGGRPLRCMFQGCSVPRVDRARGADAGRPADVGPRAWLRGPRRPRRVAPRPGDGGAGGQAGSQTRGLRAGGRQVDAEPASGAERARANALSQNRPRQRGDRGVVRRPLRGGARHGAQRDHPRSRRHRRPAARPPGRALLPRLLRLLLLSAALRLLRRPPAGGQAAARRHRCQCRGGCAGRPHRRADPRPLAERAQFLLARRIPASRERS